MIKTYCDVCNREIGGQELAGIFTHTERKSLLTKGFRPENGKQEVFKYEDMLCERCATELRTKINWMVENYREKKDV